MTEMRIVLLVPVIIAAMLPGSADAYSYCSEPSEPSIPSGYYADEYEMESAEAEVRDYLEEMEEFQECLIRAAREAEDQAESILDEWNSAVQQYNNR